ncbi:MAG TPA: four helix bundle protein [Thermoanaerobaculia bacterium]|nr:four helix bundle protein [Thermoanaerobaculia bacterium]
MKQSLRDLFVWTASVDLAVRIIEVTSSFGNFALANQMQRAAISVSSNIAEGQGRLTRRDHQRFLGIARGSLYELETQLEICARTNLINARVITELRDPMMKISAGITHLIASLDRVADRVAE